MRIFDHPTMDGFTCPICGTSEDKPVTLVGVVGTQEGNNIGAIQYHIDCLHLVVDDFVGKETGEKIVYQFYIDHIPDIRKKVKKTGGLGNDVL